MSPCGHQAAFSERRGCAGLERDGRGLSEALFAGGALWTRPEACEGSTPGQGASGRSPQTQGGLTSPCNRDVQGSWCGGVLSSPCASTLSLASGQQPSRWG